KAITLGIVKPLHCTFQTFHLPPPPNRRPESRKMSVISAILRLLLGAVKTVDPPNPCNHALFRTCLKFRKKTPAIVFASQIFLFAIIRKAPDSGKNLLRITSSSSG